jgi:MFS family permease
VVQDQPIGVDGEPERSAQRATDRPPPLPWDRGVMTSAGRARWAVGVLFLTNGAVIANIVPRYPDLVDRLDLDRVDLGVAVGAYGLGALVFGVFAGPLVHRFGSARVALGAVLAATTTLAVIGTAWTGAVFVAAMVLAGTADAVADVAENTHGLRVERLLGRSVLNTMHAMWSVGAVLGGLMGSAAAALRVPLPWHLLAAAVAITAAAIVASRFLLPGPDRELEAAPAAGQVSRGQPSRRLVSALPVVLALGLVAASAQLMEDTTATWSALYLRDDLAAGAGVAGLGFVALQSAQILGRVLGDPAVTRWGDRIVARAGAAAAGAAMGVALLVPDRVGVAGTLLAFAVVGLGIGTIIPSAMRRADALPGLRAGTGLTMVSTVLRITLVVVPVLLGVTAQAAGERVALAAIPVAAVVVLVLAGVLPARVRRPAASASRSRSGSRR